MKRLFLLIYALLSACFVLQGQDKKDIRALSKYLADMVAIRGDNYYPRVNNYDLETTEKDSLLILTYNPVRVDVPDFMISNHEVTNFEYRQFIDDIKDSLVLKTRDIKYPYRINNENEISISIYPDTSVWITDFTYSYFEPLLNFYFSHIAYKNYPVVGISYNQANAYIQWLNTKLKIFLEEHHFNQNLCSYKLPTELEWQYAAYGRPHHEVKMQSMFYPWAGSLFNNNGKYKANFGPIFDKNGIIIKDFCDDDYCSTSPVKSFDPNYFGLYDLSGNVSEWVSDTIDIERFKKKLNLLLNKLIPDSVAVTINRISSKPLLYKKITTKSVDSISRKEVINELMTFSPDWNKIAEIITDPYVLDQLKLVYYKGERDVRILKNTERPGIIKGGSFHDSPVYMMCGITQVFPQSKCSSRLGFRVAMTINEEMWKYLK